MASVGDTLESFRSSDATLTANVYTDAATLPLTGGVWLVIGVATVVSPANLTQRVTGKLWDGTTNWASTETTAPAYGAGLLSVNTVRLSKIVTVPASVTVRLSVASTAASVIKAAAPDNAAGNTATWLQAVKIA